MTPSKAPTPPPSLITTDECGKLLDKQAKQDAAMRRALLGLLGTTMTILAGILAARAATGHL